MQKATIERRVIGIVHDFQRARKVWGDLVGDGLTQANTLVNVQLQQGYVDSAGYWPPALEQFTDLKDRFESKLQKKADALAVDFEITFTKMSAQYVKMKLQASQFEYLMEEATENLGEAFTYKDPLGTTSTMEQIWIQLERVLGLYSLQINLNREILDALVARNHDLDHAKLLSSINMTTTTIPTKTDASASASEKNEISSSHMRIGGREKEEAGGKSGGGGGLPSTGMVAGFTQIPVRRDKDQDMILLSAWLNQPHLKTDTLNSFDEFCQVELFGSE